MFLVFLVYALFGFSFTLGKITLFYGSPIFYTAMRMTIGGALMCSFLFLIRKSDYRPSAQDWPLILQVTLFGIVVPYCLRAWGLQRITATKAAFLFTLMPFFTALFAYWFHKEKLTFQKSMGLLLGFAGMMPTLFTGTVQEDLYGAIGIFSFAELAVLASVASFGYNFIALTTLVKHRKCPAPIANGLTMLLGGIISWNISFLVEPVWVLKNPYIFFGLLAVQILISNIICLNLQASLLRTYSPVLMAFAGLLIPLCASFFSWLLLNEQMHMQYLVSFAMVIFGLLLFYQDELSHQKKSPSTKLTQP